MHKHGRHNTEAIFSSVVIRIHLFKSILGGTGEHWIFQVDHISPAMGKKKKKEGISVIGQTHSLRNEENEKNKQQVLDSLLVDAGFLYVFSEWHTVILLLETERCYSRSQFMFHNFTQTIRTRSSDWQQVAVSSLVSRRCVSILSIREELMQRFT